MITIVSTPLENYTNFNTSNLRGIYQVTSVVNNMSSIFVISKGKILRPNKLLLFLLYGDINPNPGPKMKAQCHLCFRTIAKNSYV